MAINVSKGTEEYQYYYAENGATFGPFTLSVLLTKITPDTMVYREGVDWTNARNIDEFKHLFARVEASTPAPKADTANPAMNVETGRGPDSNPQLGTESKKAMFQNTFSFSGRIRRTEYGLSVLAYALSYGVLSAIMQGSGIAGLIYIPLIWFIVAQGAKRCHDRGNSGWYQIIPLYGLLMLFAEGDAAHNEYGAPPK